MNTKTRYYKATLHQLIDHIIGKEKVGRPFVPADPPFPRRRHVYVVDPEESQKLYVLFNCMNIAYYTNRFNRAKDIPNIQEYLPEEMFRLKPIEVLEEIDKSRFAFIKDVLNIEYVGHLVVGEDGDLVSFCP